MNNKWSFGIYLRLSNENTSNSINNQRLVINNFLLKRQDIEIYNTYIDEGFTGTNFDRPAFKALLEDIRLKRINGIIVKDLSRLGRNYISVGTYIDEFFPANNIRFISINDNIDTINSLNQNESITTSFKNIINELYVKDISTKVKANISYKRKTGKFISGNTPYGYKINPNNKYQLVIDEAVYKNVVYIFSLYLKGYGINRIVKQLNKKRIVCPAKYKKINIKKENIYWTNTTVHNILTNRVYCGELNNLKHIHQPIIQEETFKKVQNLLEIKRIGANKSKEKYLFSGFIKCFSCKAFMLIKKSNTTNYEIYCSTYARINEELCSSHYITSRYLEKIVSININNRIKDLFIIKKRLLNIKNYMKRNNYLTILFNDKDLIKKYLYNANLGKKLVYEKWKLKKFCLSDYFFFIDIINKYIFLVERLKKLLLKIISSINNSIDGISYLNNYLKYRDKALSRKMLELFIDVIYIKENSKISIIYKDEDKIKSLKNFIEDFFSE